MYQKSALTHLSQHMNITPPAAWEQLKTWFEEGGLQLLPLTSCYVIVKAYHRVLGWAHTRGHGNPLSNGGQLALVTLKLTCHIHITVLLLTALLNIWFTLSIVLYSNSALQTDGCEKGTVALNAHNIFMCNLVINLYTTYCETLDHLCNEIRV